MRWPIFALILALAVSSAAAQDMALSQILIEGEGWRQVDTGYEQIHELRTSTGGEVFVTHSRGMKRLGAGGVGGVAVVDTESRTPAALGVTVTGDRVTHYGTRSGKLFRTRSDRPADARPELLDVPGLKAASGVALSPDRGTLFVGDAFGKYIWAFRVEKNGELTAGQRYGLLRVTRREPTGVSALLTDSSGRIWALTSLGVQVLDPTGRLSGVLTSPTRDPLMTFAFGGPELDRLYIASKTTIYVRKVKTRGTRLP